jgi:phytoene dehydrogenase-like protein
VLARPNHRAVLADPLRDPGALSATLFNRDATLADKLRTFLLARRVGRGDPETLLEDDDQTIREGLLARGFSERYVDRFFAPFYGGITLDRSLSTAYGVFAYTFRMFAEGAAAVPADGMGAIPAQLAERAQAAGAAVEMGTEVTALSADDGGATLSVGGETVAADAAVVATDPGTARELAGVEGIPGDGPGCVTQYYALPADRGLDVDGRIVLNTADERPNQVVAHSEVAPEYAPDGRELVSATFLGAPDDGDDDLAAATRAALSSWFPERGFDEMETVHTDRIPTAGFAQAPGFHEELPAPDAPAGPVVLGGECTRWSSIQGALAGGRAAADAAAAYL